MSEKVVRDLIFVLVGVCLVVALFLPFVSGEEWERAAAYCEECVPNHSCLPDTCEPQALPLLAVVLVLIGVVAYVAYKPEKMGGVK